MRSSGTDDSEQWRLSTYSTWRLQPLKMGMHLNMAKVAAAAAAGGGDVGHRPPGPAVAAAAARPRPGSTRTRLLWAATPEGGVVI